MKTTWAPKITVRMIRLAFIVLFVYTASSKLMHLGQFRSRLERMPYIEPMAPWIAFGVPFVELVITGILLIPRYQRLALFACLWLMASFTAYISIVLFFSGSIPCSCGGIISSMGWRDHILFNMFFMFLALVGIFQTKKYRKKFSKQNTT